MSGPLKLPLHLPASRTPDHDSLQHRIFQIHSQKGDFRNVTEALLINDIRSQKREDDDSKVADIGGSETDEPENGYQMIIKGREDMMQQLRYVYVYCCSTWSDSLKAGTKRYIDGVGFYFIAPFQVCSDNGTVHHVACSQRRRADWDAGSSHHEV